MLLGPFGFAVLASAQARERCANLSPPYQGVGQHTNQGLHTSFGSLKAAKEHGVSAQLILDSTTLEHVCRMMHADLDFSFSLRF